MPRPIRKTSQLASSNVSFYAESTSTIKDAGRSVKLRDSERNWAKCKTRSKYCGRTTAYAECVHVLRRRLEAMEQPRAADQWQKERDLDNEVRKIGPVYLLLTSPLHYNDTPLHFQYCFRIERSIAVTKRHFVGAVCGGLFYLLVLLPLFPSANFFLECFCSPIISLHHRFPYSYAFLC